MKKLDYSKLVGSLMGRTYKHSANPAPLKEQIPNAVKSKVEIKITNNIEAEQSPIPTGVAPTVKAPAKESLTGERLKQAIATIPGVQVLPDTEPHRCSSLTDVQTWYIIREGYYLGYDVIAGAFAVSDRHSISDDRFFLQDHVFNIYKKDEWQNGKLVRTQLSRVEFMQLVESKLPWKVLQKAYLWDSNRTTWPSCVGVRFNVKTPTLIM